MKKLYFLIFYINQEPKAQLIVFSETIPESLRKVIKKHLTTDVLTINLAERNTKETADDDDDEEVKF